MSIYTKRYADNKQRDPKWRERHGLVHNPRANFVYPRASIKARERGEFRHPAVRAKLSQAMGLAGVAQELAKEDSDARRELIALQTEKTNLLKERLSLLDELKHGGQEKS